MSIVAKVQLKSISELKNFINQNLLSLVMPKQILLLEGEMGSGKTEFVKQLVLLLGDDAATSPSFAIHNTYQVSNLNIEHLDLYRLENEEAIQSIGFWDLFENESSLIIIEWPDKVNFKRFPISWSKLNLKFESLNDSIWEITLSRG